MGLYYICLFLCGWFVQLICVCLLLLPHSLIAGNLELLQKPSRFFEFSLHSQAVVVDESQQWQANYIIALGKYKKNNNIWFPESSFRTQGFLQRHTLELPRDYKQAPVFEFYQQQLPDYAKLLFECRGRGCGQSNNWANDHFGVKFLYGTDSSQYYAVYVIEDSQQAQKDEASDHSEQFITIYTIRRGNRRIYTQLEVMYSSFTPTGVFVQ